MTKKTFAGAALLTALLATAIAPAQTPPATLTIHTDQPISKVSPTLYGLMTEEINYSYDGGLYAEMVRNRTFGADWSGIQHWFVVEDGNAQATMDIDKETGPSEALKSSLRIDVRQAASDNPAGVLNEGYWGMPLHPNTHYKGSFYAKAASADLGPVTVSLVNNATGKPVATAEVPGISTDWKKYEFTLKTGEIQASAAYHLRLTVAHPGTFWLNLVSLFPPTYHDRPNGLRIDIMEKLAAMNPNFLRFPGGNYVEGNHICRTLRLEKDHRPAARPPQAPQPLELPLHRRHGPAGILGLVRGPPHAAGLAVYAGYSLAPAARRPRPDLEPYVQDALDEIEYLTGDARHQWGAHAPRTATPHRSSSTTWKSATKTSSTNPAATTPASRSSTTPSRQSIRNSN